MIPYRALALLSPLTAKELLGRSIPDHDPDGSWDRGASLA
jgi:hypothetical protein